MSVMPHLAHSSSRLLMNSCRQTLRFHDGCDSRRAFLVHHALATIHVEGWSGLGCSLIGASVTVLCTGYSGMRAVLYKQHCCLSLGMLHISRTNNLTCSPWPLTLPQQHRPDLGPPSGRGLPDDLPETMLNVSAAACMVTCRLQTQAK